MNNSIRNCFFLLLGGLFVICPFEQAHSRQAFSGTRFEHLSGIRKTSPQMEQRDSTIFQKVEGGEPRTSRFLMKNYEYIPQGSSILEFGMKIGHNSAFLASKGHNVTAVTENSLALTDAQDLARSLDVRIQMIESSLENYKHRGELFDVVVSLKPRSLNVLNKGLKWLKPGGIFIIEGYTKKQELKNNESVNLEQNYLFQRGELLNHFSQMHILKYQEPAHLNEMMASIIFKKPHESQ